MKILKNEVVNNNTEITVSACGQEWKDQQTKAFKSLVSKLDIQGFRKGHVPEQVAKSKINTYEILDKAINPMVDEMYKMVTDAKEFNKKDVIVDALSVDVKKVDENEIEILFKFENYPTITTPEIKSLKVSYNMPSVSDSEVNSELARLSKNDWMLAEKESHIIAKGDMANIDFEGFLEDKPFPGGKANAYDLEIGSNSFIPGFEDQLIGLKKGDKKDIFVTFPADYHQKDLAGKKTKFAITVNEVKEISKPEFNDEYIKKFNIPNVTTLDQFRNHIKSQILEMKQLQSRDEVVPLISSEITKNTKISYFPASLLKDEKNRMLSDMNKKASQEKKSPEEYVKSLGFKTMKEFEDSLDKPAQENLTLVLGIEKLIERLNIKVTEADVDAYFEKLAKYYGISGSEIKKTFENRIEGLKIYLAQQKLFDEIIKQLTSVK